MNIEYETVTACPHCGLLQKVPALDAGSRALCSRCSGSLRKKAHDSIQRTLALALAGVILFAIANAYPFLAMHAEGRIQETTLTTGIWWFFENGMQTMAILVLVTSILVPLFQLLALVYLLVPLLRGTCAPHTARLFKIVRHLMPWSMMEVFLLGILVSMIKLSKMAVIVPGVALWAYVALIGVLMAAFSGLNPHEVWRRLPLDTEAGNATPEALMSATSHLTCHSCLLTVPSGFCTCPRCGDTLHSRKPKSLQRTLALVLAATILYIPANVLPITVTRFLGAEQADTIMSGVLFFMFSGSWHIALVIFVASVLIPLTKLLILIYLLISVKWKVRLNPKARTRLYRMTEAVGRWSMVDVYVVTVLVALVQLDPFATITAGPGVLYFAAVVVITMFAAESFDPRLLWDREELI